MRWINIIDINSYQVAIQHNLLYQVPPAQEKQKLQKTWQNASVYYA